ncbi:4-alpha-glucanotransferase [Bogoriella caseilytica]|uniref:4-alpha-glucanotransferase n=1 Tax=Bogoriella caseilytica TaxID=56055 RepID=A0A3N2BF75_9MICO|nr:4-alpha-glucanotransferase [Bogoriella caseilytica]ROR73897.1 4-alpha-glucanotransferase [Bogoriella caseilytica]
MSESDIQAPPEVDADLAALATVHGVATEYEDNTGSMRPVPGETVRAVLHALGVPAADEKEVLASLDDAEVAPWRRFLPPSAVVRAGQTTTIPVHAPADTSVVLTLQLEDGTELPMALRPDTIAPRLVDGVPIARSFVDLPEDLPQGWHRLRAAVGEGRRHRAHRRATTTVAVVPQRLPDPLDGGRGWGAMAQLYSMRSAHSWGLGDLADLAELADLTGTLGGDFLLINPLHAAEPTAPMSDSPYLPATRRFVNPIYIRPEDIREAAYLAGPERALVHWAAEEVREMNSSAELLNRNAVWSAKSEALSVIYAAPRSLARQSAFERFRAREGRGLEDFALWCALYEEHGNSPWPPELLDAYGPHVARVRRRLAGRIDFFAWLQWVADEQLAAAQRQASQSGMGIGIMHDLAVGVHGSSAEVWTDAEVFATGVTVGAPPDMYNQQGQDWSQPPWRPDRLAETGYAPLRNMLRTVLRHAGAIRVDHIMGLFRLWWVPQGRPASEGTYVTYDGEAMLGVLLLEASRAGAVVIGEDLGTVEPEVREQLAERGVLGSDVLWFAKSRKGRPLPPSRYRTGALATVTTHDLPPSAGYLAGEHVDLRRRLGLLTRPAEVERMAFESERAAILNALRSEGLINEDPTEREIVEALHGYVARTAAVLVGMAFTDAVGERRTQNQPGTFTEYPNWRLPLADGAEEPVSIEELARSPRLHSLVERIRTEMDRADLARHARAEAGPRE